MPRPKFRCHVSLRRASPNKSALGSSARAKADGFCSCRMQALAFAVVLPGWEELEAWRALNASPRLRRLVVVAAADHGAPSQPQLSFCASLANSGAMAVWLTRQQRQPMRRVLS